MNAIRQSTWLLITLIMLACSAWYFFHQYKPLIKLDSEALLSSVDATATELIVHQFDKDGLLAHVLVTPLMEHIPKNNIYLLQSPQITVSQKDQPDWNITSLKAKSFEGGQSIVFMHDVVVHQKPGDKTQESTFRTEEITYYPKEKKASTNLFVSFEQPGNIVESTGMIAYLDEKRVELLHGARGSYAAKNKV